MTRGKRQVPVTLWADEALKLALAKVARSEDRTVSSWLIRKVESDPTVQVVLQQVGARKGTQ